MRNLFWSLAITAVFFLNHSCKEDEEDPINEPQTREAGTPGTLSVSFSNETTLGLQTSQKLLTPSYFGLKVISVELLSEEGRYVSVWLNDQCTPNTAYVDFEVVKTEEEKAAEIEAIRAREGAEAGTDINVTDTKIVQYPYYNAENCNATDVTNFIDLARDSSLVNAEINSQGLPVPPGTYTEASLRLCSPNDPDDFKAQKFQVTGMAQAEEVTVLDAPSVALRLLQLSSKKEMPPLFN